MAFNLDDYRPVQERINDFYRDHPDGRIVTRLESLPDDFQLCRYRAELFRTLSEQTPAATGHAVGIAGDGSPAGTNWEETAETSAIGRALANLGYAKDARTRPSREEMTVASARASKNGYAAR